MRTIRFYLLIIMSLMSTALTVAQDVIVNITPVQRVLPPQLLLYVSDPGKYFNITLTNTTSQQQNVYLALSIQQTMPSTSVSINIPSTFPPSSPFVIPANGTKTLTTMEMKTMFNHIPSNQIQTSPGLFDDYTNGSFGLLPEGDYEAHITAYRWAQPKLDPPVVVSNPMGGKAYFTVCYKAQAPQFLMPVMQGALAGSNDVADLDVLNALFSWTPVTITCAPTATQYRYALKVVEVLENQSPSEAIEKNPVVYRTDNLVVPQCIIPINIIENQFYLNRTYAAQVTASSSSSNPLNYVMIENSGKSPYRLFRLKTSDMNDDKNADDAGDDADSGNVDDGNGNGNGDDGKDDDGGDKPDFHGEFSDEDIDLYGEVDSTKLYTFKFPDIQTPVFARGDEARKMIEGQDLDVSWVRSSYKGGEGLRPDTVKVEYDVELYRGDAPGDIEAALATEPIFWQHVTADTLTIPWDDIKELVKTGTYMVMRVNPVADTAVVAFAGDTTHIRDFAVVESLSKKYFQCSSMIDITNTKLTSKAAEDYKGQTISIGQYQLTIDEIKEGTISGTFSGKGHVLWKPFGYEIGVCVKFSNLKINTDDMVIDGIAESYSNDEVGSDIVTVDKLFSDWGIDHLMSDTGIPFVDGISGAAHEKAKDLAKQIDLSKYYKYVKTGRSAYGALTKGKVDDLYMPLSIPDDINDSPIDIQIVSMKFAATYATMDILGEFMLPNTSYSKNDILVLGAPRICISPDRLLPESGTVALLSDFTVKDPKSSYEMTFKAPKNVIEPVDGCYVSWHADKFEQLGLDLDMKVPGLVRDRNGVASNEQPVFNVKSTISDWDDWTAAVNVDPFQVSALPGWTFTASDIIYDHSLYQNSANMGKFPNGYNKTKAGITAGVTDSEGKTYNVGDNSWQGLYIGTIGLEFPKSLEIGTTGSKRLNLKGQNMFFDKSGATLDLSANNIVSAKTGKIGGWEFSLDKVTVSFIQNNFTNCKFSGQFAVPLFKGKIAYDCQIMKLTSNTANAGQYAYVFKTKQVEGLSLDFLLGQLTANNDQTYFLLESVPTTGGGMDTSCELMIGGDITIGGSDYIKSRNLTNKPNMMFDLPGVHFCGMRLSNKPGNWGSKYEKAMQAKAKNATLAGKELYKGEDLKFGENCYLNMGRWSLSSDQKKLGGFDLTVSDWKFSMNGTNELQLYIQGNVSLVSGINISAKCGLNIFATVSNKANLKNLSLAYKETTFNDLTIDLTFADMGLYGTLKCSDKANTEGYEGSLKFTMPGDLFSVEANGGYFKTETNNDKYTYGWFYITAGSKSGIQIPPVAINGITGGFYYNCRRNGDSAIPQKGLIGVIAGIKLSTSAGEDAINADVKATVVYDKEHNRLSTFVFNGKVEALSGLLSADANLVYEHNDNDNYLQLDVTVDGKADTDDIAKKITGANNSFEGLKSQLDSSYKGLKKLVPQGSFTEMEDIEGKPEEQKKQKKGEKLGVSMGTEVNFEVKLTWKRNGTKCNPMKWYVCLGQPDLNKRCEYTWLKFKSKIVSVDIGANGYICVGNELPGNGSLPAIPTKISNFLNGSKGENGLESATLSQANTARNTALNEFKNAGKNNGGGVMFGGQLWGYFDVDLGVFFLNAGATAGFDISLLKVNEDNGCMNIKGKTGYKGWYGYGQLYAYLYAKFGINIDLGFWETNFKVLDAGVGGVFQMQAPNPTNFSGKARVKLKLLNGLVNVNRSYSFSCGQHCDMYLGDALDDFELFEDLSCGYDNMDEGWDKKNAINPKFSSLPYFKTAAALNEPFRVLDETAKAKLAQNFKGSDTSVLDMEASRTFVFQSNVEAYVSLFEYNYLADAKFNKNFTVKKFYIKNQDGFINYLDIKELNPNKYYKMVVTGYAKEIKKGDYIDPEHYDETKKKYVSKPWSQTQSYYFRTGEMPKLSDIPEDFTSLVAIAYPANCSSANRLKSTKAITAHLDDVEKPNLAFYQDVSQTILQNGKLQWLLYDNTTNLIVSMSSAVWNTESGHSCNLIAATPLAAEAGKTYRLVLRYISTHPLSEGRNNVRDRYTHRDRVTTNENILVDLIVKPQYTNWTGNDGIHSTPLDYERPFIGARINSVKYKYDPPVRRTDHDIMSGAHVHMDGYDHRVADPYWYISYMSNYGFIGGWKFTADKLDVNITTSQSLIYTDKGGKYEGKLGTGESYNIVDNLQRIRDLSVYTTYHNSTEYPLPKLSDSKYSFTIPGLSRVPEFKPSSYNSERVIGYIKDMYSPAVACTSLDYAIWHVFDLLDRDISFANVGKDWEEDLKDLQTWYDNNRGGYQTVIYNSTKLQVPNYQFPIVYGSCLNNAGKLKKVTAWGTLEGYAAIDKNYDYSRGHAKYANQIHDMMYGSENYRRTSGSVFVKNKGRERKRFVNHTDYIESADFSVYRCNTYNYKEAAYWVEQIYYNQTNSDSHDFTLKKPLQYVYTY